MKTVRDAVILVVDDDAVDLQLMRIIFKRAKILNSLHTVKDGAEALDFLFKRNGYEDAPTPDIIFMDLRMPVLTGTEVLETIQRDMNHLDRTAIIMLTGSDADADIELAQEFGATAYITKPLDVHKIMETVFYNDHVRLTLTVEE